MFLFRLYIYVKYIASWEISTNNTHVTLVAIINLTSYTAMSETRNTQCNYYVMSNILNVDLATTILSHAVAE